MSTLTWDQVGERLFETGVSKGVLYKADGFGVAWNGLIAVDDAVSENSEPVYFDGVKFNDIITPGDFAAVIRAFTYPDEFLEYEGTLEDQDGFFLLNQPHSRFGLSYQTINGDDINGIAAGYKVHILYNLVALPSTKSYKTLGENVEPIEFEWNLTGIPEELEGFRPTVHVVFDSSKMDLYLLADLESILYGEGVGDLLITNHHNGTWSAFSPDEGIITDNGDGTFEIITDSAHYLNPSTYQIGSDSHDAYLPSLKNLASFIRRWERLIITDNHNGKWTAYSPVEDIITVHPDQTFEIISDTAEYIDVDTYTIKSSNKNDNDIWLPPIPTLP